MLYLLGKFAKKEQGSQSHLVLFHSGLIHPDDMNALLRVYSIQNVFCSNR